MCSNKWKHSTALAAEAMIVLDLVQEVVGIMKIANEGKLKMYLDCKIFGKCWQHAY